MRKQPNSHHCIVCGLRNDAGVRVAFYDTVSAAGEPELLARFTPGSIHQGYPGRMHGGIASGILDEVIGRSINSGSADGAPTVWGVAVSLSARFEQPVPLEVPLTARGRITRDRLRIFDGTGEIYLPDGTVAVSAEARYFKLSLKQISEVDPEELGWKVYADEI